MHEKSVVNKNSESVGTSIDNPNTVDTQEQAQNEDIISNINTYHNMNSNVQCILNNTPVSAFIDGGNRFAECISPQTMKQIGLTWKDIQKVERKVKTAKADAYLNVLGRTKERIPIKFGSSSRIFWVRPYIIEDLNMPVNISKKFLVKNRIDELHSENALLVDGKEKIALGSCTLPMLEEHSSTQPPLEGPVYALFDMTVPANHCMELSGFTEDNNLYNIEGLIETTPQFEARTQLQGIPVLANIDGNGLTRIVVCNDTQLDIKVQRGSKIATFSSKPVVADHWDKLSPEQAQIIAAILPPVDQHDTIAAMAPSTTEENKPSSWPITKQKAWLEEKFKISCAPAFENEPPEIKERALNILLEHIDIFGLDDTYGVSDVLEHEIHLTDDRPIRVPYRMMNPAFRQPLKEQIDKWLRQKVIKPSKSPYSFQLVFANKKNGKLRTCIDLRILNQRSLRDSFPMPNMEEIICRMEDSKIFTVLDATGAYHCIKLRPEDTHKTAFNCCFGHFEFLRMPFGLSGAPATYNRLITTLLQDLPLRFTYAYLDDTLLTGNTAHIHLDELNQVLTAYQKGGITLQPDKCEFFQKQVQFLGHTLSEKGVSPLDSHLDVIKNWPEPKCQNDVKVLLGKFLYYRSFIPNAAHIAAPLTDLTMKTNQQKFHFDAAAREAFNKLKELLASPPILAYPRFNSPHPFCLDTDWSNKAIAGVLTQWQDGHQRVIRYGARKLAKHEKNYASNKGEMLALIFFMRKWRLYLQYRKFLVRSDHQALKWIKTQHPPRGMVARWLSTLSDFDFDEVIFRKGADHGNADALSRIDHADEPTDEDKEFLDEKTFAILAQMENEVDMAQAQQQDDTLKHVHEWLTNNKKPKKQDIRRLSREVRDYWNIFEVLYLEDNVIWRKPIKGEFFRKPRVCVPVQLQEEVIRRVHQQDVAHLKINKTQQFVLDKFYWPGAHRQIEAFVACCITCKRTSGKQAPQHHTYATVQEGYPWRKICIDFVGPYKTSPEGYNYVLTVKDTFSRYLIAIPLRTTTAQETAQALEQHVFLRYGMCEQLHSDNGAQLTSNLLEEVYKVLGIKRTTTPCYNPKSNPTERTHRELNTMLKALAIDNNTQDWQQQLQACVFALNTSRNRHTGLTPYYILFGTEARIKTDLIFGTAPNQPSRGPQEYANQLRDRLQSAYQFVRWNLGRAVERTRFQYNETEKNSFKIGDLCWLFTPRVDRELGKKLNSFYTGPYRITERVADVLFRIVNHGKWNRTDVDVVVSIDRLSPYYSTQEPQQMNIDQESLKMEDEFMENIGEATIAGEPRKLAVSIPQPLEMITNLPVGTTPTRLKYTAHPEPVEAQTTNKRQQKQAKTPAKPNQEEVYHQVTTWKPKIPERNMETPVPQTTTPEENQHEPKRDKQKRKGLRSGANFGSTIRKAISSTDETFRRMTRSMKAKLLQTGNTIPSSSNEQDKQPNNNYTATPSAPPPEEYSIPSAPPEEDKRDPKRKEPDKRKIDEDSTDDQENKMAKTQAPKRQAQSILSDQEEEKLPRTQAEKRTADPTYQLKSDTSEDSIKVPKVEGTLDNLQELDASMKEPVAANSEKEEETKLEETHNTKEGE